MRSLLLAFLPVTSSFCLLAMLGSVGTFRRTTWKRHHALLRIVLPECEFALILDMLKDEWNWLFYLACRTLSSPSMRLAGSTLYRDFAGGQGQRAAST